jgi:hypothetical protein
MAAQLAAMDRKYMIMLALACVLLGAPWPDRGAHPPSADYAGR